MLEVPTGALADRIGRKKTLLLSSLAGLFHTMLIGWGNDYPTLILGMLVGSLGMALWSGTDVALLYDSLKELNRENDYKKIKGASSALFPLALAVGSLSGSFIAKTSLALTIRLNLLPQFLFLIVACFFVEPKMHQSGLNNIYSQIRSGFGSIKNNQLLQKLILIQMLLYGIGESAHTLAPAWFRLNIQVSSIGIAFALVYLFSALGSFTSHWISEKLGNLKSLLLSSTSSSIITLSATLLTGPLSVFLATTSSFFYGLGNPIHSYLNNRLIDSGERATVNSVSNLAQKLLFAAYAPILGFIADQWGVIRAIQISILILSINIILISRLKQQNSTLTT